MTDVFDRDQVGSKRSSDRFDDVGLLLIPDPAARYEPFPLTDVQKAYWVGRSSYFELGNIGCHVYFEFDVSDIDRSRMSATWQKLIDRHEMLRAVVRPDATQQVLPHTPHYEIKHLSLRTTDDAAARSELLALRDQMAHQVFAPDRWPLFDLRTTEFKGQVLLHFSLDLLFVDLWSLQLLFDEWAQLTLESDAYLAPLETSFRDYVLTAGKQRATASYGRAEAYWLQRIATLPPAPKLPLVKAPHTVLKPTFTRRQATLASDTWRKLKARSTKARLTPSGLLMAAFSRVLAAWSQTRRFTLNTTVFQRAPLHPHVYRLVGDFTSIVLVEVNVAADESFEVLARRIAEQFRNDLEHRDYGGLQLLQEIAKRGDPERPAAMPVVFTSALAQSMPGWRSADTVGDLTYGLTQTPQVYLDHQVYERNGALHLTWDAVDELFPPGLLDDMFAAYSGYVRRLAEDETAWTEAEAQWTPRQEAAAPVPAGLLHGGFLEQVHKRPHHTAVVSLERRLSYEEVYRRARHLARQLRRMGAGANRLVAVVMEKGWEQIVATIAILEAGGAYLPIDPDLPRERRWHLLRRGEVDIVLTQPCVDERLEWPSDIRCVPVDWDSSAKEDNTDETWERPRCGEEDLAYVIFTSGSTGEPKGVMVEHRSALNTILDVNERFGVGPDDRVLALSSLSFDLSVYDIFGALAAGATIVLPHASSAREPGDWASLVLRERVTVWNSVPALLDLLMDHVGARKELLGDSLRLALLSGDWTPVKLPDRCRDVLPALQLISLGGATEASIWSIFYPIGAVGDDWTSIPYGRALRHQQMHVLNDAMQPSPTWVPGEIYIGGIGLARGYWRDEDRTNAQFLHHPQTGERLYRTGDRGRCLPSGDIEFLGREDDQVKIQGFRVELGEIEAALVRHPQVKAAVVVAVGERTGPKHLAAYVVADRVSVKTLEGHLHEKLPAYMVPSVWQSLEHLPLTPNGKINRKALPIARVVPREPADAPTDRTDALARVTALICEELGLPALEPDRNLLTIGATSIDLVRIVARLEKEFGFRPSFQEFFRDPTSGALARLIEQRNSRAGAADGAATPGAQQRRTLELIVDPQAREAFRREGRGIRLFAEDSGRLTFEREEASDVEERFLRRGAVRRFLPEPVPLAAIASWLAELRQITVGDTVKHAYGSAGGCYPVQTYLHAKHDGIEGCPAGTYYYQPVEHCLVPLTLGAELDPAIHEPFTNRPIFERARFSLFFVHQPDAIEPMYGDLAWRFSILEAGAMAQVLEASAWRFGIGVCPIGWVDLGAIRTLLQLEDGQELLHAHVGGLADPSSYARDWEEGSV